MRRSFAVAAVFALCGVAVADHGQQGQQQSFLERLRQAEVVVVSGSADHLEQVLRRAQVKFVVVQPSDLPQLPLHGQQVLMVNCTGEMSPAARERVRRFVTAGGFLYTTDHAVAHLLEPTFPGFIQFNHKTTQEEIFPMQVSGERGLIRHITTTNGHPRWQLASGGYLFDVVDQQRVEVLMRSKEVASRYGTSGALAVRFRVGDGQVIHATGHFFTQPGQRPEVAAAGQAFETLSQNVVLEKAADKTRLDDLYNVAPRQAMEMRSAPAPTAAPVAPASGAGSVSTSSSTKVRVLGKKGGFANVRDAQGNEGWVPESSL